MQTEDDLYNRFAKITGGAEYGGRMNTLNPHPLGDLKSKNFVLFFFKSQFFHIIGPLHKLFASANPKNIIHMKND